MKKFLPVLPLVAATLLSSCEVISESIEEPVVSKDIGVNIAFDSNSTFSTIADSAIIIVKNADSQIVAELPLSISENTISGIVSSLPVGNDYEFILNVYNDSGEIAYSGESTADIFAGKVTSVSISLYAVTGSAIINGKIVESITEVMLKCVAKYDFDGTPEDVTGNGHHGEVYGAMLAKDRFGNDNSAYYFDGIDDKIVVPFAKELNTELFSIALWVNVKENNKHRSAIASRIIEPEFMGYCLYASPEGMWQPHIGMSTTWYKTFSRTYDEQWTQYVITYDGSDLNYYIDGLLESTGEMTYVPNRTEDLIIGAGEHYGQEKFHWYGSIDDIEIYNYALSADTVQSMYTEGGWPLN